MRFVLLACVLAGFVFMCVVVTTAPRDESRDGAPVPLGEAGQDVGITLLAKGHVPDAGLLPDSCPAFFFGQKPYQDALNRWGVPAASVDFSKHFVVVGSTRQQTLNGWWRVDDAKNAEVTFEGWGRGAPGFRYILLLADRAAVKSVNGIPAQ